MSYVAVVEFSLTTDYAVLYKENKESVAISLHTHTHTHRVLYHQALGPTSGVSIALQDVSFSANRKPLWSLRQKNVFKCNKLSPLGGLCIDIRTILSLGLDQYLISGHL